MEKITKSSRHSKIIGRFGEYFVANWLSRDGWEVAVVDHTGIDLVAFDPVKKVRIGISVKSRTRNVGKENTSVTIYESGDKQKHIDACKFFACQPWIAIYVETSEGAEMYMRSIRGFDKSQWSMSNKSKAKYWRDPAVKCLRTNFTMK